MSEIEEVYHIYSYMKKHYSRSDLFDILDPSQRISFLDYIPEGTLLPFPAEIVRKMLLGLVFHDMQQNIKKALHR